MNVLDYAWSCGEGWGGEDLECIAKLQHGSASADKLAAAGEAALDDCKELAAGLEDIGLLGILHGLPALLLHQALHGLPQLLLLSVHIHAAPASTMLYTLKKYHWTKDKGYRYVAGGTQLVLVDIGKECRED